MNWLGRSLALEIKDMERAIALVNEEWRNKRMTSILEKEKNHG